MTIEPQELIARARALPAIEAIAPLLGELPPLYLVGGAVRDLLRGERSVDVDLAVDGDAAAAARRIAAETGATVIEHDRFGTASIRSDSLSFDLAQTRRERYPRPGALPEVEPAAIHADLDRRDFSVNALALGLSPEAELIDPHDGAADLEAGLLRVLHRRSFLDDPTRIIRGLRYEARLGLQFDRDTEGLAREALAGGALATVSNDRVRDELLALLAELRFDAALERGRELGVDRALHPALQFDPELAAAAALAAGETGADRVLAALAALVGTGEHRREWLQQLGLDRNARERVLRAGVEGFEIAAALPAAARPSEVHELLRGRPEEALALALALGAPGEPVLRYLAALRHVRLEISGDDLVAAGLPPSPAIGRALEATLRLKLDGAVSGRDDELERALELARGER